MFTLATLTTWLWIARVTIHFYRNISIFQISKILRTSDIFSRKFNFTEYILNWLISKWTYTRLYLRRINAFTILTNLLKCLSQKKRLKLYYFNFYFSWTTNCSLSSWSIRINIITINRSSTIHYFTHLTRKRLKLNIKMQFLSNKIKFYLLEQK